MEQVGTSALISIFLPLFGFILLIFSERIVPNWAAWIGVLIASISFVCAVYCLIYVWNVAPYSMQWNWFSVSPQFQFKVGIWVDNQSALMAVVVTLVALLVNIYSIEYKKGDRHYNRFFAYIGIFVFAMMGVVFADNLLITFIFWELVGFASYLLIGFWFDKEKAVLASKKAFLINKVSDVFFLIGLMILWADNGTLQLSAINYQLSTGWAALCIFIGCMGKSAQFPFQIWLPDAMEGPTPVSALIHAATMVAAGVYLMVRISFLITPDISIFIMLVGAVTAFVGAFAAITQYDLKRVLAFSTVSQLGVMMAGIGVGAYEAAFFHLVTHAFFKACLFLSAGSVIHGFHHILHQLESSEKRFYFDKQDMRSMGGVRKYMPITFIAFLISGCALAGIPFFSGFISKDAILTAAINTALMSGEWYYIVISIVLLITACMTACYIFRLLLMVFGGELRIKKLLDRHHIYLHESKILMLTPLCVLAILSISFLYAFNITNGAKGWLMSGFSLGSADYLHNHTWVVISSTSLVALGIFLAYLFYNPAKKQQEIGAFRQKLPIKYGWLYRLSFHQFYLDKTAMVGFVNPSIQAAKILYKSDQFVVDRLVNWVGISQVVLANILAWFDRTFVDGLVTLTTYLSRFVGNFTRKIQGGNVQKYFLWAFVGLLILVVGYCVLA